MQTTLDEIRRRAALASLATDPQEVAARLRLGLEVVALPPRQLTTPRIATMSGIPHTYVRIGRFF